MLFNLGKGAAPGCFSFGLGGFSVSYGWNVTKKFSL